MNRFRKIAGYIIGAILMSMLIISFGLWGIGDMLRVGGHSNEVAHVGGTHIPVYGWVGWYPMRPRCGCSMAAR